MKKNSIMEILIKELEKDRLLSPFRRNKDIEIHSSINDLPCMLRIYHTSI
jgi:hypothetical protein